VNAGLRLGRIEQKFGPAVFLLHGIIGGDGDLVEGLAIRRHPIAEHGIVHRVSDEGQGEQGQERKSDEAL